MKPACRLLSHSLGRAPRPLRCHRGRGRENHPQRFLRSDARALPRLRRALRRPLGGGPRRRGRHGRAVARRLRRPGPRRHRGPAGRRRHAGARGRHRRHRPRPDGSRADWKARLPSGSAPYTSTIVFLVRKGNPKGDQRLGRSREARRPGDHAQPEDLRRRPLELSRRLGLCRREVRPRRGQGRGLRRRPLPQRAGARFRRPRLHHHLRPARHRRRAARLGERGLPGAARNSAPTSFEIVVPSLSIRAVPPVAVVDANVDAHGTRDVAEDYLRYLYSDAAQKLIAANFYRPVNPAGRRPGGPRPLPRAEARRYRRSALRRLGEGAGRALRRRRHLRPDLRAAVSAMSAAAALSLKTAERHPRLRPDARLRARLSRPRRASSRWPAWC